MRHKTSPFVKLLWGILKKADRALLLRALSCCRHTAQVSTAWEGDYGVNVVMKTDNADQATKDDTRSCVMLSIIIGVNILNWYGAVIAQSGRQFDESGLLFHNQSDIIIGVKCSLRTVDTICL